MIQNFTPNDVLLANSGELPKELSNLLQLSLCDDPDLQEFSDSLRLIEGEMKFLIPPTDEQQVQSILSRVRSLQKKD
jgi:hypothetical protein